MVSSISILPGDSVLLTAIGDSIEWYDAASGGNLLATGPSYQTPPLDQPVTYYLESISSYPGEMQLGGKPDNSGNGGLPSQNSFLYFNAWEPFTLHAVTVYAVTSPSGQRTIQLMDANNNILQEAIVSLNPGQWELELEFPVPAGNFLSLRCAENNLFRNNSGVQFPYPIGTVGEITSDNLGTGNYYYYFYNWKIQQQSFYCPSDRVPLTVQVSAVGDPLPLGSLELSPNPTQGVFQVKWSGNASLARLIDATGKEVLRAPAAGLQSLEIDASSLAAGLYHLQLEINGRWVGRKLVKS